MFAWIASAALGLASPPTAPAAPEVAAPALYVIRDADTTIYLFGTFHVLNPDIHWFDGRLKDAFDQSDELVVETIPPKLPATRVGAQAAAPIAGVTVAADFLATAQQAVKAGQAQGMAIERGADMVLLESASGEHKAVEQLETIGSQYRMISSIPREISHIAPSSPAAGPRPTIDGALTLLQAAWTTGEHGLFAAMANEMRVETPETYRILFASRNARWSDWVAARMRSPGTVFVAVGAAHLAGPDSLLIRLAERGYISRRVRTRAEPVPSLDFSGPLD